MPEAEILGKAERTAISMSSSALFPCSTATSSSLLSDGGEGLGSSRAPAAVSALPQGSFWENSLSGCIIGSRLEKRAVKSAETAAGTTAQWQTHSSIDTTQSAEALNIILLWSNIFALAPSPRVYVRYCYTANWLPLIKEHLAALPLCWQGSSCCFFWGGDGAAGPPTLSEHPCWGERPALLLPPGGPAAEVSSGLLRDRSWR